MSKKKRRHPQGHYCKVCGEYKANEKFSGKGHAAHICKACSQLSAAEQAEAMTINRLMNFPIGRLSASDRGWLENRLHDQRPEVAPLAREIYNLHFPFAERNARKKKLTINKLVFELHTVLFDVWGDELPINKRFTADRISRILTMTDFDADGVERSMELDGGKMSAFLRWVVHSLEIFMWPEDYDLDPGSLPEYCLDDRDEDAGEELFEAEAPPAEPRGEASWQVWIEYADQTTQEIISYRSYLTDHPEELYLAILEYFEPEEDEFDEGSAEDEPFV